MTNSSALVVPAPRPATAAVTNDIRGIKAPVEIPSGWAWLWWTLGTMLLVAAVVAYLRARRKKGNRAEAKPVDPPAVRARRRLEAALALMSEPERFCVQVSDTIRWYFEEQFACHAPDRTTEEFLSELQATSLLTPDQKKSLTDFLTRCDLVKFARYEPTQSELQGLHGAAMRLVNETEPPPFVPPLNTQATSAVVNSAGPTAS